MASQSPPRLPIGMSDFRQLREPGILYVDKTDFVTQVLAATVEVVLVPRPRRFGKTVNLSTLRYFVEASKEDRTALFEGLSVWGSPEARKHYQRYPVIWLTLKDIKARSFENAFEAIRRELARAYGDHAYLLKEGILESWEATAFQQILRGEGEAGLYARSLVDLSGYLARYHNERAFILIDEYDTPIHAIQKGENEFQLLEFFRSFLSGALKDNSNLARGVLTGILRVAKESLFSGLNNLVVYSLLRTECSACFGFTPEEVKDLTVRTGTEAFLPDIERWYNGYRFGGQVIYNPWSVLNFLASQDKVLRPYWVHTSSDDLLRRVIFTHGLGQSGELETLLAGGEIEKRVDDSVAIRDLDLNADSVWGFLLFTGYLKATHVRMDGPRTMVTLAVPNVEVHYVYDTIFRSWFDHRLGSTQVDELMTAILTANTETCERLLGQLLQSLSMFDLGGPRRTKASALTNAADRSDVEVIRTPEQVYHVFVVTLLLHLQPRFAVRSNRESGGGRYDVMVTPRTPGQPGVVLELKVRNRQRRETVKAVMATALRQIREKDYAAELRAAGADPIHEIGIVFDGKYAWVETAKQARTTAKKTAPSRKKPPAKTKSPAPKKKRSAKGGAAPKPRAKTKGAAPKKKRVSKKKPPTKEKATQKR